MKSKLMFKANQKKLITLIFSVLVSLYSHNLFADSLSIDAEDGIQIIAETYIVHQDPKTPLIVLYHQAGWSRGEYLEIAPKLNQLGFNCIAVDLRSGESVNNIPNLTAQNALDAKKEIRYIDALPDIVSSLRHINSTFTEADIIAWGSSYSAALVLHVAGEYPDLIDGVLSFAPGEYFSKQGKSKSWIKDSAVKINTPVFITSARNEEKNWSAIFNAMETENKTSFLPETKGNHGSRALWEQFSDSDQYWLAVTAFLEKHFK